MEKRRLKEEKELLSSDIETIEMLVQWDGGEDWDGGIHVRW